MLIIELSIAQTQQENYTMSYDKSKSFRQKNTISQKQSFNARTYNHDLAKEYGINTAVILGFFNFYTNINKSKQVNSREDETWVYHSADSISKALEIYTARQIRYAIKKAHDHQLIKKANYNKTKYDRTTWYSLTDKAIQYFNNVTNINSDISILQKCQMEVTKVSNGDDEIVTPIQVIEKDIEKVCGETSVSTAISLSKQQTQKAKSKDSEEARKTFEEKFKGRSVTYDELFSKFEAHCEKKGKWVMLDKWMEWIEREMVDNYERVAITSPVNKVVSPFTPEEEEMLKTYAVATAHGDRINIFFPNPIARQRVLDLVKKRESIHSQPQPKRTNAPTSLTALYQQMQQRQYMELSA